MSARQRSLWLLPSRPDQVRDMAPLKPIRNTLEKNHPYSIPETQAKRNARIELQEKGRSLHFPCKKEAASLPACDNFRKLRFCGNF